VKVADAAVSGGVVGAEEASLQIMVGCDRDIYEQIKPALLGIGDKITYIGEIATLVHNQIAPASAAGPLERNRHFSKDALDGRRACVSRAAGAIT